MISNASLKGIGTFCLRGVCFRSAGDGSIGFDVHGQRHVYRLQ